MPRLFLLLLGVCLSFAAQAQPAEHATSFEAIRAQCAKIDANLEGYTLWQGGKFLTGYLRNQQPEKIVIEAQGYLTEFYFAENRTLLYMHENVGGEEQHYYFGVYSDSLYTDQPLSVLVGYQKPDSTFEATDTDLFREQGQRWASDAWLYYQIIETDVLLTEVQRRRYRELQQYETEIGESELDEINYELLTEDGVNYDFMDYAFRGEMTKVLDKRYRQEIGDTYPILTYSKSTYWHPYGEAASTWNIDNKDYQGPPEALPYGYPSASFGEGTRTYYFPDSSQALVLRFREYNNAMLWVAPPILE